MKAEIKEVLNEIRKNNFNLGGKASQETIDKLNIQLILEFAKHMCELQKVECGNNAEIEDIPNSLSYDGFKINQDSILKCKNVCDE